MRIVSVAILLWCTAGIAVSQFEGTLDMKMTGSDEEGKSMTSTYTMFVKKDMVAANIMSDDQRQQGKFIVRTDKKVMWIVNDLEKNYVEIPFTAPGKDTKSPASKGRTQKLRNTGKTMTLLGYPCQELISEDSGESSQIWATAKLGNIYESLMKSFERMNLGPEGDSEGWESELARLRLFPLRITTSVEGAVRETQEVTRIDRKPVPSSVFEEPAGYVKQSMEHELNNMMQQFQQQMKKDS